ncbi:MAG TPA: adenosine deaminase [Microbacteriaceae bacterium]|nr:adenosine deaminase [Microbacteriaceae bacterium]
MNDETLREPHLLPDGTDLGPLPKVSLHDHLDGGLRPQTVIELADQDGVEIPEHDAGRLARWFAEHADSGSLVEYLRTFDVTVSVMQTRAALTRVAGEFVDDLVTDGVVYGEVRWAPEQHLSRGLTPDDAVDAVQEGIDAAVARAAAGGHEIRVGQLVSALRHRPNALEAARLAVRHRGAGVVGFDIAGPEDGFPPAGHREAFDYLAQNLFPVTVHAGEAAGVESIRGALVDGRALRLGHGVRIAQDLGADGATLGPAARWVRDRRVPLELSPSSNVQTGAIAPWGASLREHPFDSLYRQGFTVTVNTDNRLMSATTLTRELALLAETFGYGLSDIARFQRNAAEAAFLPLPEREELARRLASAYAAV